LYVQGAQVEQVGPMKPAGQPQVDWGKPPMVELLIQLAPFWQVLLEAHGFQVLHVDPMKPAVQLQV
jgi:hypothetical protein